jgi:hypothetical protein
LIDLFAFAVITVLLTTAMVWLVVRRMVGSIAVEEPEPKTPPPQYPSNPYPPQSPNYPPEYIAFLNAQAQKTREQSFIAAVEKLRRDFPEKFTEQKAPA